MLSRGRTGAPQAMQREPGRTTDCPSGTRAMHRPKKLPQIAPNTAAAAIATGDARKGALPSIRAMLMFPAP
jgi:hypothetical protein